MKPAELNSSRGRQNNSSISIGVSLDRVQALKCNCNGSRSVSIGPPATSCSWAEGVCERADCVGESTMCRCSLCHTLGSGATRLLLAVSANILLWHLPLCRKLHRDDGPVPNLERSTHHPQNCCYEHQRSKIEVQIRSQVAWE